MSSSKKTVLAASDTVGAAVMKSLIASPKFDPVPLPEFTAKVRSVLWHKLSLLPVHDYGLGQLPKRVITPSPPPNHAFHRAGNLGFL